jgi:hypothetical protein
MAFSAGFAASVIPTAAALAIVSGSIRSDTGGRPVVPVEATSAILEAFQTHQIVALPDAHGNQQNHAFRLALIRDRRFAATVNDIVIELGNSRYQDLADRFVRGEEVPDRALQRVWRDTTQVTAGNNYDMMRELFETVRTVNASLPGERRLRVLLGDPPIDWDATHTPQDHRKWIEMREWFPAAVIEREVLAQQRRALVMFGSMHLQRRNLLSNFDMQHWQTQTIVSLLEGATPTQVFTVWPADLDTPAVNFGSWPGAGSCDNPRHRTGRGRPHAVLSISACSFFGTGWQTGTDSTRAVAIASSRGSVRCRALSRSRIRVKGVSRDTARLVSRARLSGDAVEAHRPGGSTSIRSRPAEGVLRGRETLNRCAFTLSASGQLMCTRVDHR